MNRDERSKIMMQARQFLLSVADQCNSFRVILDTAEQAETSKLENMPESLIDCENSSRISESIEALGSAKELLDEISSFSEQIPDVLGIRIRKPRKKTIYENLPILETCRLCRTAEKRTERLQLVVTPTLATALKRQSGQMKISTNELINRILLKNLETVD